MKIETAQKLISAFEKATDDYAFLGTIPIYGQDDEEQRAINSERRRIKANMSRARTNLLKALTDAD